MPTSPQQNATIRRLKRGHKGEEPTVEEDFRVPGHVERQGEVYVKFSTGRYVLDDKGEIVFILPA